MDCLFICYTGWSTCKKARSFLDKHSISYHERNIKTENPTEEELKSWIDKGHYPIKNYFNSRGKIYRELGLKDRLENMSQDEIIKLLATDGMLVKRPILIGEDKVLVGFKEEEWEEILNK